MRLSYEDVSHRRAADRFTTRNLRQLWARLFTTSGPTTGIPLPMPVQLFAVTADTSTAVYHVRPRAYMPAGASAILGLLAAYVAWGRLK